MPGCLEGKVALVTGGSRGIGAAVARRLAADGAAVALTYSRSAPRAGEVVNAIESAGGRAIALAADAADAAAVRESVETTVLTLGRLDILVNNAGIAAMAPLDQFSIEDFDHLVAVNIRAVFIAAQAAVRHMREGGRIITIGSCTADRFGLPGGGPYAMTKAAVAALGRGLARDLGVRGITVNTIQPGPVDTEMNPADGQFAELMRREIAIGRYGHADEVAELVAFLAGPKSAFITGASLTIDGGANA